MLFRVKYMDREDDNITASSPEDVIRMLKIHYNVPISCTNVFNELNITSIEVVEPRRKRTGWINVYRHPSDTDKALTDDIIYKGEDIAKSHVDNKNDYIGTFPFAWEE